MLGFNTSMRAGNLAPAMVDALVALTESLRQGGAGSRAEQGRKQIKTVFPIAKRREACSFRVSKQSCSNWNRRTGVAQM